MNNLLSQPEATRVCVPAMLGTDNSQVRLILVDDENDFREAASAELEELGFSVESFSDGAAMLAALADGLTADVVVLDWSLPTLSGIDLLPRLRREGILLPVIFLTGRSALDHESLALDRGALDFVDKTRGMPILARRIRLLVDTAKRPHGLQLDETVNCGRVMLKPRISRAYWDGTDLDLTLTEFNIVKLLVSNAGNHVSYRAVYDCVHHEGFIAGSGEDGYRTNVRSSIKRIRNKFKILDPGFAEIENYASFGYRWGGPADRAPARSTEVPAKLEA
jgi:two-component system response regulator ChvI